MGLLLFVKPAVRLRRPLHRCSRAIAFRQPQVVAHADLVAVSDARACPAASSSGCKQAPAAGDPLAAWAPGGAEFRAVELHILFRSERREDALALFVGQTAEVEFIVVAQETVPTAQSQAAAW